MQDMHLIKKLMCYNGLKKDKVLGSKNAPPSNYCVIVKEQDKKLCSSWQNRAHKDRSLFHIWKVNKQ